MDYLPQIYDWFGNCQEEYPTFENPTTENHYFNDSHDHPGIQSDHELHQLVPLSIYDDYQQHQLDQPYDLYQNCPQNSLPIMAQADDTKLERHNPETTGTGDAQFPIEDLFVPESKPDSDKSGSNNRPKRHAAKALNIVHWTADMVCDPRFDHLICWRNFEAGEFIIKSQVELAKLWGKKQKKGNMDFAKYSRALRYHYIHSSHREMESVPAKLIYRFSQSFMKKFVYPRIRQLQSESSNPTYSPTDDGNFDTFQEEFLPQEISSFIDSASFVNHQF